MSSRISSVNNINNQVVLNLILYQYTHFDFWQEYTSKLIIVISIHDIVVACLLKTQFLFYSKHNSCFSLSLSGWLCVAKGLSVQNNNVCNIVLISI